MVEQNKERWVEVYKFYDEIEKEALEMFFKGENIPIDITSRECSAYDGVFKSSTGAGIIRVEEDWVDSAKEVIADFEKAKQTGPIPTIDDVSNNIPEDPLNSNTNNKKSSFYPGIIIGIILGIIIGLLFNSFTRKSRTLTTSWDTNGDGEIDTWAEYSQGKITKYTYDQNYDGKADRWCFFRDNLIIRDELDINRDTKIDRWNYYEPAGEISRSEDDLDYDGKVEYIEYLKKGRRLRFTADNDRDGNIDEWGVFENGAVKEKKWSYNNDNIIDKKALYKNGRKIKELYDRDRDGSFDEEITLDQFERIIKSKKK